MSKPLLIFETHPIQYRAPVFQAMQRLAPDSFEVIYASDFSVRGYKDAGFGASFAWDLPLLSGYAQRVLGNETERKADHWSGLTARGVDALIGELKPSAVLMSSMSYAYNWAAYWGALRRGIPIWLRMETQDEAQLRGPLKGALRGLVYRALYAGVSKAFYIGQLSREHLLRHGMSAQNLLAARYCTPNPFAPLDAAEKLRRRTELRATLGLAPNAVVVGFFGKLIPKKDPLLILRALQLRPADPTRPMAVLVVGSGELEGEMRAAATALEAARGIPTRFAGFINQSKLPDYYLACDIVALPSHRMGETWGLVVNEALHAGCGAVVSAAVGCHRDFQGWERFGVVPVGDAAALAAAIDRIAEFPRSFEWADAAMQGYSTEAAAAAIVGAVASLDRSATAAGAGGATTAP
jgi:glycosyltransferase involved in cell wall biosynthesis